MTMSQIITIALPLGLAILCGGAIALWLIWIWLGARHANSFGLHTRHERIHRDYVYPGYNYLLDSEKTKASNDNT